MPPNNPSYMPLGVLQEVLLEIFHTSIQGYRLWWFSGGILDETKESKKSLKRILGKITEKISGETIEGTLVGTLREINE